MADSKLSNLPAASAFDGTELMYAVQSGVDVKATSLIARGQDVLTSNRTYYVAILSGTIVGGTLYTNGTYTGVSLTGGTGTGAIADIIIAGGSVTVVKPSSKGNNAYIIGDVLSATAASIGGTGSGFTFTLTAIGSDSNNGLSATTPFLTVQKAFDTIIPTVTASFTVVVQCDDGIYTPTTPGNPVLSIHDQWLGGGALTFQGDITSPATRVNVTWLSTGTATVKSLEPVVLPHDMLIQHVQINCTGGGAVDAAAKGEIELNDVDLGSNPAGAWQLLYAHSLGTILVQSGETTILNDDPAFYAYASNTAQIDLTTLGKISILTSSGGTTANFSDGFYYVAGGGYINQGSSKVISGTFTGLKYNVVTDGFLFSAGPESSLLGSIDGTILNGTAMFNNGAATRMGLDTIDPLIGAAYQATPTLTAGTIPLSSTCPGRTYLVSDSSTTTFWAIYGGTGSTTVKITSDGSSSWKVG